MKEYTCNNYELWQKFKDGDQYAFQLMYSLNYKILLKYGVKIAKDEELVRDTVQDLFMRLWLSKQNLGDTDNIEPYLKASLRHDLLRKIKDANMIICFDGISQEEHQFNSYNSHQFYDIEEKEAHFLKLDKALEKLPNRVLETLKMRYFEKMGNQEIAERMNINYQSVNNNIHRGIEILRLNMKKK